VFASKMPILGTPQLRGLARGGAGVRGIRLPSRELGGKGTPVALIAHRPHRGLKRLETIGNDWRLLETVGDDWKRLETIGDDLK